MHCSPKTLTSDTPFLGVAFHKHTPMFIHTHSYRTRINIHLMTISVRRHLTTKCSSTFGTSLQTVTTLPNSCLSYPTTRGCKSHTVMKNLSPLPENVSFSLTHPTHTLKTTRSMQEGCKNILLHRRQAICHLSLINNKKYYFPKTLPTISDMTCYYHFSLP